MYTELIPIVHEQNASLLTLPYNQNENWNENLEINGNTNKKTHSFHREIHLFRSQWKITNDINKSNDRLNRVIFNLIEFCFSEFLVVFVSVLFWSDQRILTLNISNIYAECNREVSTSFIFLPTIDSLYTVCSIVQFDFKIEQRTNTQTELKAEILLKLFA